MINNGGFHLKVERAKFHFSTLKSEIEAFDNTQEHCTWERELEAKDCHHVYRVKTIKEVPSSWSPIIGDFLSNMRSALDVLAYQLALSAKPNLSSDEKRGLGFPIVGSYKEFLTFVPRLMPMTMKTITTIEALQPYNGRKASTHALMVLHNLDKINKHRNIHITVAALKFAAQFQPDPEPIQRWIGSRRLIPGAEIGRYIFPTPHPEVDMNPAFGFRVIIDDPAMPSGESINDLFARICRYIDTRVIPSFV
jgi:hypothetical protein